MKKISIIIPVYNSSKFIHKTVEAVDEQRKINNWDLELILIDDGSPDNSYHAVETLATQYDFIKGIKLSRNFGHQIAVKTGLGYANGDYIAIIDDDLQDPPSLLPRFIEELDLGYEVVYGIRRKRKENFLKKFSYSAFYRILDTLSDTKIPLDSGDFCMMTKKAKDNMLKLQEQNPYLRGIRAWIGFNQKGLEYERNSRIEGESGYSLKKLYKIAKDGIFSFSSLPLKIISFVGNIGLFTSFLYAIYILISYFNNEVGVTGYTSMILIILFFNSILLISIGIVGEYIFRIYNEVRNRPFHIIEKTINL